MKKLCGLLIVALVAALAGVIWYTVLRGSVAEGDDGRTAILLPPAERNLVLAEMRQFLEASQGIVEAIASNDMQRVVKLAREVGTVDMSKIPASLFRRLPGSFKKLGFDTHDAFLKLADDVEKGMDREHVIKRLGEIMLNCTTCHAGWRIDPEPEQ